MSMGTFMATSHTLEHPSNSPVDREKGCISPAPHQVQEDMHMPCCSRVFSISEEAN